MNATRPEPAAAPPPGVSGVPGTSPRVLHVITALAEGGAERQLELLVRQQGRAASVVALYDGGPIGESLRRDGYDVRVLGMGGWRRILTWLRLAWLIRQLRPDVVHVHLLAAQLWGIPAARLARVPVTVSSEHSLNEAMIEGRDHARWLVWLYRLLAALATHTIAVSEATRGRLVGWGVPDEKISVIDNGLDFAAMAFSEQGRRRVREEFAVPGDVELVGAVGRLHPSKRFDRLLTALAPRLGPRRRLLIVGEGQLREELTQLAAALGVTDHVSFAGARNDMRDIYSAMDVLVSPSQDETFGIAVVEGRACGLPVVFATCPAITGLGQPLPGAYQVRQLTGEAELAGMRELVDQALAERPGQRWEPPQPLQNRYAISSTAGAISTLYQRLLEKGGNSGRAAIRSPQGR